MALVDTFTPIDMKNDYMIHVQQLKSYEIFMITCMAPETKKDYVILE